MPAERRVTTKYWTQLSGRRGGERELVALAESQHGVIALEQLRAIGLSASAVRSRAACGRLHRIYRGVYALGRPSLSVHGRWMAATLACGPNALLSHRSAGALHELLSWSGTSIEITLPVVSHLSHPGIRLHRSETIASADRSSIGAIACTSLSRTLLDLAGVLDRRQLERACDQAEVLRLLDMNAMNELLARAHGRRGVRNLRTILGSGDVGKGIPRSELEERFLDLCRRAGLPKPSVNESILLGGQYVEADFVWRDRRLVVETDGYRTHGTRQAFRRDRRRDQLFACEGWRHARFTWEDVSAEPERVTQLMRALLNDIER